MNGSLTPHSGLLCNPLLDVCLICTPWSFVVFPELASLVDQCFRLLLECDDSINLIGVFPVTFSNSGLSVVGPQGNEVAMLWGSVGSAILDENCAARRRPTSPHLREQLCGFSEFLSELGCEYSGDRD